MAEGQTAGMVLAEGEQKELARHEAIIERGLKTFVEVGNALLRIREGRLYREGYATFEVYCRERWDMERAHAYRLIDAAAVVENVSHGRQIVPINERQARPLTRLDLEQQREAWQRAVEVAGDGKITAGSVEQVVKEILGLEDEPEPLVAESPKMAVHFSSGTVEHYTPLEIIEATLSLFGGIDLDPCSNSRGQPNVPAGQHFTREEDGLVQEWHGRVYMNPPYGRAIRGWVEKLCVEYEEGQVGEAIALLPARTDTQWWVRLRDYPVCLIRGRLSFGEWGGSAPFPSAVFYLGSDVGKFHQAFHHLGDIWQRRGHDSVTERHG